MFKSNKSFGFIFEFTFNLLTLNLKQPVQKLHLNIININYVFINPVSSAVLGKTYHLKKKDQIINSNS
jgi:hypothetical protein